MSQELVTQESSALDKTYELFGSLAGHFSAYKTAEAAAELEEWKAKQAALKIQTAQPDYDAQDIGQDVVSAGFAPRGNDMAVNLLIVAAFVGFAIYISR